LTNRLEKPLEKASACGSRGSIKRRRWASEYERRPLNVERSSKRAFAWRKKGGLPVFRRSDSTAFITRPPSHNISYLVLASPTEGSRMHERTKTRREEWRRNERSLEGGAGGKPRSRACGVGPVGRLSDDVGRFQAQRALSEIIWQYCCNDIISHALPPMSPCHCRLVLLCS
jgi:hypothetical protein